jgi:putative transposase
MSNIRILKESHLLKREQLYKATKQAIMNGEKAFKKFFKGESGFSKFKKKKNVEQ